jgi:hypothetical protein
MNVVPNLIHRCRVSAAVFVASGVALAAGHGAAIAAAADPPTLGLAADSHGQAATGFGTVAPPRVWLGGDASTLYFRLTWRGWGQPTARAAGRGYYLPPYDHPVFARVVAFDLGMCDGHPAYQRVKFAIFHHRRFTSPIRLCA